MLSPEEFTVGSFRTAQAGSLILPRSKSEALAVICVGREAPVAVFLAGQHAFRSFPAGDAQNWKGVVVPNVRFEVDPTSLHDPDLDEKLGVLIREDSTLSIWTQAEQRYSHATQTIIQTGLPGGAGRAAFSTWQIVIGHGQDKRILHHSNQDQLVKIE